MASKFLIWIKFGFIVCCMIGFLGFAIKTSFDQDSPTAASQSSATCEYNGSVRTECGEEAGPSILKNCICGDRGCQNEDLTTPDGMALDFDTICSCANGNGSTIRITCNVTDESGVCFSNTAQGSCNASILTSSALDIRADTNDQCVHSPCEQWTEWTNCTSPCDSGTRHRIRRCPTLVNDLCSWTKLDNATAVCNTEPCPRWSPWSSWSSCTATCNTGVAGSRTRTRACPKPNACGGLNRTNNETSASSFQTDPCISNITCPTWTDWEPWGECSRTCGRGDRTRHRRCSAPADDSCLGSTSQMEPCFVTDCPFRSDWSPWSPCTTSCGGGSKSRSRITCPQGPPSCPLASDQASCNEQACPQWSEWDSWMACSKTCGAGQRIRRRRCPIRHGCLGKTMQLDKLRCNNFPCPTTVAPSTSTSPSSTV